MSKIDVYVTEVLRHIMASEQDKRRIRDDLTASLHDRSYGRSVDEVIRSLGSPADMAKEFMVNFYGDAEGSRLIESPCYEYRSKTMLFGLPLVHIKSRAFRGGRTSKLGVARGIIAIGDISVGWLSIGSIAFGGVCLGGVSAGLISLGGLSIGALLALGGVAIGGVAVGGLAVGLFALGGAAIGVAAIGDGVAGKMLHDTSELGTPTWERIKEMLSYVFRINK